MTKENFKIIEPPTGNPIVEFTIRNKPRQALKALLDSGCIIDRPIESLSDYECGLCVRFIYLECKKREAQ